MTQATTLTPTPAATWKAALGQLEIAVTRANYDTWLRDTVGLRHDDTHFVVGAQNDFAIEWLATRMRSLIERALARVVGRPTTVAFEVARSEPAEPPTIIPVESKTQTDSPVPDFFRKPAPPAVHPALTFDSFVVGDENAMAYNAARAVAAGQGSAPLYIFGTSGLGKTHLLNAIAHEAHGRGLTVIYAPAERFGNDYVRALSSNSIEQFRARYRSCDVLLLDDIQFLEGKEKFQTEFFHVFNDLHGGGKRIVISGDRPPSQLSGLSDALRTRLGWGLAADLQKPQYETRLAILRAKAEHHAVRLPLQALITIAEKCCPTVRELEGWLNRVIAYVPLVGGDVSKETIEKALSPLTTAMAAGASGDDAPAADAPTSDGIINAVCRRTGATPADLRGRSRVRDVAYARHLAMYLLRMDARISVAEIGRTLGHRDHATVLQGIKRITNELTTRQETIADTHAVRTSLRGASLDVDVAR
jgi:chromosomal replication initiator protein